MVKQAPRHTLVVIGHIGDKQVYLDVPRDDAIRRFVADQRWEPDEHQIKVYNIGDEFRAYDIFENW